MHSHSLFSHKRAVSICCACILLAALIVGALPYLSFPAAAEDAAWTSISLEDYFVSSSVVDGYLVNRYVSDPAGLTYFYGTMPSGAFIVGESAVSQNTALDSSSIVLRVPSDSLGFTFSGTYNYTANKISTYNTDNMELLIWYYDAHGKYLGCTSKTLRQGKFPAGSNSLTFSFDGSFLPDAVYMHVYLRSGATGQTLTDVSFALTLEVKFEPPILPVDPSVSSNFSPSYSYNVGAAAGLLSVTASITDEGVLSYQWYENMTNSTSGGTPISGATSSSYTPSTSEVSTKYYYCAVTNTLCEYTSTVYSNVCAITVSVVPPKLPTVTSHFAQSYTYKIGDAAAELVVSATVADDGVLTYQWYVYEHTGDAAAGYEAIPGATSTNYQPVLDFVGTRYYMCQVTNTLSDLTVSVDSNSVMITVKPMSYTLLAGQYEMNVAADGLYYPLFPWPEDIRSVDLIFRSSGIPYSQMSYKYDVINEAGYYLYYDSDKAYLYAEAIEDEGFLSDAYALIFIEADQTVPTEFYEWFVGNFTYVGPDEEIPIYYTTINIMDNAGNNLLDGVTFPGNGMSPVLYGYVVADGLTVLTSAGLEWPWTVGSDVEEFLGFSIEPGATVAWYIPDETFTIGGTASDAVLTLYLVVPAGTSVDDDYAASSLNWFERIFYDIGKGFNSLGTAITNGFNDIKAALAPSEGAKLLGIIDLASIGEFFRNAYEGVSTGFGLMDLLSGEDSPFAWLIKE